MAKGKNKTNKVIESFGGDENALKKELIRLYVVEEMTTREVGEKLGIYRNAVSYWLKKFNISKSKGLFEYQERDPYTYKIINKISFSKTVSSVLRKEDKNGN